MYYEINIAKTTHSVAALGSKYRHFFATAPRSITTLDELIEVYDALREAFPLPDYIMTVTQYEEFGKSVNMDRIKGAHHG
jgi:hypothetical protein